jgi:hypothetical protein
MMKNIGFTGMRLVIALIGGAGLSACAGPVPQAGNPCPCATGYVCCASGTCAKDQPACDAATSTAALFEAAKGVWTGYLENFSFASGSDAIAITIAVGSDGTPSGTVVLGTGEAPAPPTDPNTAWPPNVGASSLVALEGFPYEAGELRWEATRLRFTLSRWSPWHQWCRLQTSYLSEALGFSCVPAGPALHDDLGQPIKDADGNCLLPTVPQTPVDCAKAFPLCMGTPPVCECDATGCDSWELPPVSFDLALRNGFGDGSSTDLSFGGAATTNIRLTKIRD